MAEICEECGNSMVNVIEMYGKRVCERCAEHMSKQLPEILPRRQTEK